MSYANDREAFILANTYGLLPPAARSPSRARIADSGKYEPDRNEGATSRTIVIAHWFGKSNLLIKYNPAELIPPP